MPLKPVFTRDCGDGLHFTDEPTGNLDSGSTGEIMGILKELHSDGRTVILITHDNEIAAQAKRVIRIKDGRIESDSGVVIQDAGQSNAAGRPLHENMHAEHNIHIQQNVQTDKGAEQ